MCCPFYNENLVADINIKEASKWVDEIHVTECNKSFKYGNHDYCFKFKKEEDKVKYHKLDGGKLYLKPRRLVPYFRYKPISKWMTHIFKNTAWYNDGVSRNYSLWNSKYSDDDILILSDIDEIIDSKYANEIIDVVKKEGIVTINLYFTMFYFNLWCKKWPGPQFYSYRIFIVRGDVMRNRFHNDSDFLRKLGERGQLINHVKCLDGIKGFHHSWLGDENFIINKLNSYAHDISEGTKEITDECGNINYALIKQRLKNGTSIFDNVALTADDNIPFIDIIKQIHVTNPQYFI